MGQVHRVLRVFVFVVTALVLAAPAFAADIVAWHASPQGLALSPLIKFELGRLTVNAPDGVSFQQDLRPGTTVFTPYSRRGYQPPDGVYHWEVTLASPSAVDPRLLEAAKAARERGGDVEIEVMHRVALTKVTQAQGGTFTIQRGQIVPSDQVEPSRKPTSSSSGRGPASPFKQAQWLHDDPSIGLVDQVIPDDLIVQGSICAGFDCVNNESFGFDTIRLKENNLRIKFEDTSVGSFPTNDWQLTANDSASGGSSKFSVEDITGSRVPFTITAGASTNSIFVDSTGRVGFRTSTPVLDLHVNTSNTPAHRFEQNNSGGFTAQTWDVGANEANFFVRDVTGGSLLSFRIRPGAPTSSLDISSDGDVGIGTGSPDTKLDVEKIQDAATISQVQNTSTGTSAVAVMRTVSNLANLTMQSHAAARTLSHFGQTLGGWGEIVLATGANGLAIGTGGSVPLIIGTNNTNRIHITGAGLVGVGTNAPAHPIHVGSAAGAHVTAGGIWTNGSSRAIKQDIRELTVQEAHGALEQLSPVRYTSRVDPTEHHVGFIAEDVPDLVATKDRKSLSPMDIVAVLTRVVQEQQKTVEAQQRSLEELAAKIRVLEAERAR